MLKGSRSRPTAASQGNPLLALLAGSLLMAGPALAQSTDAATAAPEAHPASGGEHLPSGWSARPDKGGDLQNVRFVRMEPGYHLTLGPAIILYRREDRVEGPFHTLATFHQMKQPQHPEGYGLFLGGQDLSGPRQQYTYFLVRGDGSFLIKRRNGANTTDVTNGWTPHPAVNQADARGKATNLLEIDAKRDSTEVGFRVNGQTVYTSRAEASPWEDWWGSGPTTTSICTSRDLPFINEAKPETSDEPSPPAATHRARATS